MCVENVSTQGEKGGDGYAQTQVAHPASESRVDVLDRRNDGKLPLIGIKLSHPVFF
jgi:hypothetical protein